jgi:two-component system, OmpR family, alkaline phosphatase synthesis response regulator PhoP
MTENNSNNPSILLVDDEPDILEFMKYNLKKENYRVFTAGNGKDAIQMAKKHLPDLILLDIMMPEMDGIETCRLIREIPALKDTYIVFLTARSEDYSQLAGFDAGADDYVSKPIKPKLLLSRIKALLRRKKGEPQDRRFIAGDLEIDREQYNVTKNGIPMDLPRKEFELLSLLAAKPGRVFTRDEILRSVWGNDVFVGDRTIDVHIRKIREKIGEESIKTVKGIGYKFEF